MSRVILSMFALSVLFSFTACRSTTDVHLKAGAAPSGRIIINDNPPPNTVIIKKKHDPCPYDGKPGCGNAYGRKKKNNNVVVIK